MNGTEKNKRKITTKKDNNKQQKTTNEKQRKNNQKGRKGTLAAKTQVCHMFFGPMGLGETLAFFLRFGK